MNNHHDQTTTPAPANGRRRWTVLGVTGGVLAGTAAGLIMGVPGLSSAASDTADTAGTAALVQQTDDGAETDDTTRADEATSRLRQALQSLVDDGTITADQADAVAAHLVANRPERGGEGRGHGPRGERLAELSDVVTSVLGIDAESLREQLRSGSTLADIATEQGVDVQTLIDALVAEGERMLDEAVADGHLTEDEAAERSATLEDRVTARVNGERPDPDDMPDRGRRGRPGLGGAATGETPEDAPTGS